MVDDESGPQVAPPADSGQAKKAKKKAGIGRWILRILVGGTLLGLVAGLGVAYWGYNEYGKDLPDVPSLDEWHPKILSEAYATDEVLIAEFFEQRRKVIPYERIPKKLIQAYIAAEDSKFFEFYAKDPTNYVFNVDDIDRIPYMAPGLVGPEKAARGKLPTDTWWHTIVSPTGKEKLGYPTQKPLGILSRIVRASSPPGGLVLDCFAGSGTTGAAAVEAGRRFLLIDQNPEAIAVMRRRFAERADVVFEETVGAPPIL